MTDERTNWTNSGDALATASSPSEAPTAVAPDLQCLLLRRRHHPQRKLREKQKEGKKRMKNIGRVEIPQKTFMTVLQPDE